LVTRFVAGQIAAEQAAVPLLNQRAGDLSPNEAARLGQLLNTHEKAGRIRLDRFSPAFPGATMQKVTDDLDRFNRVVADGSQEGRGDEKHLDDARLMAQT
jgi:hypothetical protein